MHLRKARQDARLTQVELSERSGVEQATISALEVGKIRRPGFDIVIRLARALGVDPESLFPVDDHASDEKAAAQ